MPLLEKGRYTSIIRGLWITSLTLLLLFTGLIYAIKINLFGLFGEMPGLRALENPKSELASEVFTADHVLIGKYFSQNRTLVEHEQISPHVIHALLATEDVRFHKHSGVDVRSLFRVGYGVLTFNRHQGGGSTLTQQVARNLFETREDENEGLLGNVPGLKMVIIKIKEWLTAIQLEHNYTKEEIMTMYLNTVSFGNNAYGIEVAAKTYFNKSQKDLDVEEAALLVGVVNNPSWFNPKRNPNNALKRRNVVLRRMEKYGYLQPSQLAQLMATPIRLNFVVENHNVGMAPYFRAYIRDFLLNWARSHNKNLYTDGLKIYTTIDSRMQQYAEEAVMANMQDQQEKFYQQWQGRNPWMTGNGKEINGYIHQVARRSERYRSMKEAIGDDDQAIFREMSKPVRMRVFSWKGERDTTMSPLDSIQYYKRFLHTGFMSMDPQTGYVKAWVGGINHKHFKYDHVRQGKRQPGSTFKALVYATAIDNGFTPCTQVSNTPVTFVTNRGKEYTPQNFDNHYDGQDMTLRQAMGRSINTVAAYLMKEMGADRIASMARRMGVTSQLDEVPSLCLGTSSVSVYEMLGVYSTFVNGGTYTEPIYITRIEDRSGNVLQEFAPKTYEAISEETAYLMLHMLKGALEEEGGTARKLYSYPWSRGNDIGAKTGTTQNYADGWFIGVTHNLVSGLWVGGDEPSIHFRNSTYGQGGRVALPAWAMYMDKVYADTTLGITKGLFKRPENLSVSLDCDVYRLPIDSTQTSRLSAGIIK